MIKDLMIVIYLIAKTFSLVHPFVVGDQLFQIQRKLN